MAETAKNGPTLSKTSLYPVQCTGFLIYSYNNSVADMNPRNEIPWIHNQFENSPKKAKIKSMDGESRPVENPFQEPRLY